MMRVIEKLTSAVSVTPTCPQCKRVIPSEDVNVAKDIAYCRSCNLSHLLSSLTLGTAVDEYVDLSRPPAGAWFQREVDTVVVGATHRSLGQALGLIFVCLFWNGIVSVFVLFTATSTLQHLGVPLPSWFPVLKGSSMPVGMTIFLWVFLTPFIAIGLGMLAAFLSALIGRTEMRIQGGEAVLFNGIGPLGFRKRFAIHNVRDVRIEDKRWRDSDGDAQRKAYIIVETERKPIRFGSMLSDERRRFIASVVKKELIRR